MTNFEIVIISLLGMIASIGIGVVTTMIIAATVNHMKDLEDK